MYSGCSLVVVHDVVSHVDTQAVQASLDDIDVRRLFSHVELPWLVD